MSDIRARIADAVLNRLADYGIDMIARDIANAITETVMSLPGIAIVELPEPDSTRYEGDEHEPSDRLCWMPGDDFEVSVWNRGEVQRDGYGWGDIKPLSVAEARTVAAALLAAANAAEAVK